MDSDTFWQDVMGMSGTHRQESDTNKGRLLLDDPPLIMSLVVGTILLAVHLIILITGKEGHLLPATSIMPRLENHPMCGLTTGGQEECYFDCFPTPSNITIIGYEYYVVTDPSCLQDCFSFDHHEPSYCIHSLLDDVLGKGMCRGDTFLNYTLSDQCAVSGQDIIKGTCSRQTEASLRNEECFRSAFEQPLFIQNSLFMMIYNSCTANVSKYLMDKVKKIPNFRKSTNHPRINPVTNIGVGFKTQIAYENTWICSLRTHGMNPEHLCSVNLLSVPPQPTILVGAAHCTLICKDRGQKMPSCCCITDGVDSCRSDHAKCGQYAMVSELLAGEVDIMCGEWELGPVPMTVSKERYNLILQVEEIVVHDKYDRKVGPENGHDIVIFKVKEDQMKSAESQRVYPACLPVHDREKPEVGTISGWAPPPPFYFIENYFSSLVQHFGDMFKQFHYKMEILKSCVDPKRIQVYGRDLQYPSNTSYPAGTVCAKEFTRHCFSGGDSGSPLMVTDLNVSSRFYIEGIQSFLKGCEFNQLSKTIKFLGVNQESPSVFTKLSCYLPWIAKQYKLSYEHEAEVLADKSCHISTGDPDDKQVCRESIGDAKSEERECIFPFYYEGELKEECILQTADAEFIILNFRCPTRNITTKINGINSFNFADSAIEEYCLDENGTLDPNLTTCKISETLPSLAPCKNNCPGVRGIGIIGGGALVATAAVVGGSGSLVPLVAAGLGILGIGGGGAMFAGCMGPFFCTALSGQCCLVRRELNSDPVCPDDC